MSLDLPYRKNGGVGNLVSASYASELQVKSNLYDGFRDIEIALRAYKQDFEESALFVMLPGRGLSKYQEKQIYNEIDKLEMTIKAMQEPVLVFKEKNYEGMSERISEWCVGSYLF